jgi:iron complex transport system substrate-binding protein
MNSSNQGNNLKCIVLGCLIFAVGYCVVLLCLHTTPRVANSGLPTVDMAGRSVSVPEVVNRIISIHSIPSHMLWRLSPNKMISIDIQFKERLLLIPEEEAKRLSNLPVTGLYRKGIHREDILKLAPDLILSLTKDPNLDQEQKDFTAPVIAVSKDKLADYAKAFRLLGKLVGNKKDGDMLADYWEDTMSRVAQVVVQIPEQERIKVYYAQSKVVATVGSETIMASIIRLAGGKNFFDTMEGTILQKENESIAVSIEEIIAWNPDLIIAASPSVCNQILSDSRWQSIKAVQNKRVYSIVKLAMPDRIQSLMGLIWMVNTLHPEVAKFDLLAEVRHFYELMCLNGAVTLEQLKETP